MTDYSKMSDFEINCEVLEVFNPDIKHMSLSGDSACFYDCGPTGDGWNQIDIPNYCNNPADAWPIIVENGISLDCIVVNRHEKTWRAQFKPAYVKHHMNDKNPLRAAMIVFLMMQEKKE